MKIAVNKKSEIVFSSPIRGYVDWMREKNSTYQFQYQIQFFAPFSLSTNLKRLTYKNIFNINKINAWIALSDNFR